MKILILGLVSFLLMGCEHLPGGSAFGFTFQIGGKPPTAQEAKVARQKSDQVLINGTPVDKSKYPAVVRITIGNAGCTASVVGKRKILTAAHCGETGEVATFTTVSGKKYSAKLQRAPGYPNQDLDLNIGTTSVDIDVAPVGVKTERFERKGMDVVMIGYGCIKPDGSGGNDGILRIGKSKVTAGQGYDLVLNTPDGSALCYGDSGGPLFYDDGGTLVQIGVNSKGNIADTSYTTRTTLPEAAAFLKAQGIGDGEPPPPPPPADPKVSRFEDEKVKIEVQYK